MRYGRRLGRGMWTLDTSRSTVTFWVRYLSVQRVSGSFTRWSGTLDWNAADPSASVVDVVIDAASIKTDTEARDKELRHHGFLEVDKFPEMKFRSRSVARAGENRLRVVGDLTLHGHTGEIALDVEADPSALDPGATSAHFVARTTVPRKVYGVRMPGLDFAVFIGYDIHVELDIQAHESRT